MPFLALPNEIVLQISKFQSPPDINSLLKTSRRFAALLKPELIDAACCADYSSYGKLAIYKAASCNDYDMVKHLLAKGLQRHERAILHDAASTDPNSTTTMEILLACGIDPDGRNDRGRTALSHAAAAKAGKAVEFLLKYPQIKVTVDSYDSDRRTALGIAAKTGNERIVGRLLANGAEVDWVDKRGLTPLLLASSEGHDRIVRLLLYNNANINWADHGGRTSLHIAAAFGHEGVVKVLLGPR
ncbi:ankyrin repeat-containing domain protein [Tuber borchii]|uniref:Ankyrin repeat-containing domain protein n=1 Tax=Tuber borchii TaxID=42251 RepID=A0A2T7A0P8_TUBBO|nr:ankyrin repeat-containing domain protein [Tuber borchii]